MPRYTAPGVYIEEVTRLQKIITAASTNITGFVGLTEKGPASPELVSNWAEFQHLYGGFIDTSISYLPLAVKGFFDNGGNQAYIARANALDSQMPISAANYIGNSSQAPQYWTGLQALSAIDDISILCVPDEAHPTLLDAAARDSVRNEMIRQCESRRDRFAILQVGHDAENTSNIRPHHDTSFAAIYHPWVSVFNPFNSRAEWIPSGGHVAGIYARTDTERGVHKSPANVVIRGLVKSVVQGKSAYLRYDIGRIEQSILNPRGVNVLRDLSAYNRGIRVWGARTLSSDSQWRYIAARRLCIHLEESINNSLDWLAFEENNEASWQLVSQSVGDFLLDSWRKGAMQGSKAEQAFFVRCDRSTMSADDIRLGRLVCLVGVAVTRPAEFLIFKVHQKTQLP